MHSLSEEEIRKKILLMLFIRERCTFSELVEGSGLSEALVKASTACLEESGVIRFFNTEEGDGYVFHPSYLLRSELEIAIKKSYLALSCEEKLQLFSVGKRRTDSLIDGKEKKKKILFGFWERLDTIRHLRIRARSNGERGVTEQEGEATVKVSRPSDSVRIFQENGSWSGKDPVSFCNTFCWELSEETGSLSLSHLRYGRDRPVGLLHFVPISSEKLGSIDIHLCGQDTYLGYITYRSDCLDLHWRVIGPYKNDFLHYRYR